MHQIISKRNFLLLMSKLRACYPGKVTDPELWAANVTRYFDELGDRPPAILTKAFDRAWRIHPIFFPTLGQMVEECRIVSKETAIRAPALPLPRRDDSPAATAARRRAVEYVDRVIDGRPKVCADTFVGVPQNSSHERGEVA